MSADRKRVWKGKTQEEALPILEALLQEAEAQGVRGRISTIFGAHNLKLHKSCMNVQVIHQHYCGKGWIAQFQAVPGGETAEQLQKIGHDFAWLVQRAEEALARLNGGGDEID